jgi:3'-phosphoadenosine 5'-phosphosulfate sulfotransferase (PAPS reductase)/FAD synthetase
MNGETYVAFSGGKDSTVLLDLVRSMYPEVPAVFNDTGLEFPEIRSFVKTYTSVDWLKPKKSFIEVIDQYGYPVISKDVSMIVSRYRNTKDPVQKQHRRYGGLVDKDGRARTMGVIAKKWQFLMDAPFKISERCCDYLKKNPSHDYIKRTGRAQYLGLMASDSMRRRLLIMQYGCNSYEQGVPRSLPLAYWLENDIWDYIKTREIPYCPIYDMGYDRTGCVFCMFGIHKEGEPNRFQRMCHTHPKLYDYSINKLGCGKVLDYIGIPYGCPKGNGLDRFGLEV